MDQQSLSRIPQKVFANIFILTMFQDSKIKYYEKPPLVSLIIENKNKINI